jgi:ribosomal protein S18 acetylase RimI-like enzyme
MMYEVRRIRADEWREYREFRLEALKDTPLAFIERYESAVCQPDGFWRERVARSAGGETVAGFVAVNGDRFVGQAACIVEPDVTDHTSTQIVGVYVTPAWRGRERGTAADLTAAAVAWARQDAAADRIRLFVLDVNERARRFYRRVGFVETGVTEPYPPDPSYVELEMAYGGGAVPGPGLGLTR